MSILHVFVSVFGGHAWMWLSHFVELRSHQNMNTCACRGWMCFIITSCTRTRTRKHTEKSYNHKNTNVANEKIHLYFINTKCTNITTCTFKTAPYGERNYNTHALLFKNQFDFIIKFGSKLQKIFLCISFVWDLHKDLQ